MMRRSAWLAGAVALGIALAGIGTVALAARGSSGTYALPSGNPVVAGTVISTTWANNTLGDISTELTDSLSRSGKGGMLVPLRTTDGTVAAPAHSFTNETGTGLYRIGASNLGLSVAGVKRQEWTSTGTAVSGELVMGANKITGLGTPTAATDAATKTYVDSFGPYVIGGSIRCSTGGTKEQSKGLLTGATCAKTGTGEYTIAIAGVLNTATWTVSTGQNHAVICTILPDNNQALVKCYNISGALTDSAFAAVLANT